jgi:hypothetical protein
MNGFLSKCVLAGVLGIGAMAVGCRSERVERRAETVSIESPVEAKTNLGEPTATAPASEPGTEFHPSTLAQNEPNFAPSGGIDDVDPRNETIVYGESGVGGSGPASAKSDAGMGMKKADAGAAMAADGGTGGSGTDGLGSDVTTDTGVERDFDKGTVDDNGTSQDLMREPNNSQPTVPGTLQQKVPGAVK